jgi:hypothetical protein
MRNPLLLINAMTRQRGHACSAESLQLQKGETASLSGFDLFESPPPACGLPAKPR